MRVFSKIGPDRSAIGGRASPGPPHPYRPAFEARQTGSFDDRLPLPPCRGGVSLPTAPYLWPLPAGFIGYNPYMGARFLLSPHLDDAVLSCGGLIARWINRGYDVTVLTIFAGDPPPGPLSPFAQELHSQWDQADGAVASRRAEDRIACGRLGASVAHLAFPDALYRRSAAGDPLYPNEASVFGGIQPEEDPLVEAICAELSPAHEAESTWLCPIGIGGHVDHRLTRRAAERLGVGLWYYRDLPYDSRGGSLPAGMSMPTGAEAVLALAPEEIESWATAVAEYRSQVSTFWADEAELLQELTEYHERMGGIRVFTPASEGQS